MNWKKLPKEKRNQLVMVVLIILMVIFGLGFGLIRFQYDHLAALARRQDNARSQLELMQRMIDRGHEVEATLARDRQMLNHLENGMASGDLYSWVVNTIRRFRLPYKVEIPQYSQPLTANMNLLPNFPYKQVTVTVGGAAFYHDLGQFIADFENEFPHIRLLNLDLEPAPTATGAEAEKLSFKMDIVALVKPDPY